MIISITMMASVKRIYLKIVTVNSGNILHGENSLLASSPNVIIRQTNNLLIIVSDYTVPNDFDVSMEP